MNITINLRKILAEKNFILRQKELDKKYKGKKVQG